MPHIISNQIKKSTGKRSFTFLNKLVQAKSWITNNVTRSSMILNNMSENIRKRLSNILIFFLGSWSEVKVYVKRDRNNRKTFVSVFRRSISHDKASTSTLS